MVEINKEIVTRIQNLAPNVISTHCCIHRKALTTRKMSADLKKIQDKSVQYVNYIKNSLLNTLIFSQICDEMESCPTQLLFRTDVRWLCRGKIQNRLFKLRRELQCFVNNRFEFRNCSHDWKWLCRLTYLAATFSVLNCLNLPLLKIYCFTFKIRLVSLPYMWRDLLLKMRYDIDEVSSRLLSMVIIKN